MMVASSSFKATASRPNISGMLSSGSGFTVRETSEQRATPVTEQSTACRERTCVAEPGLGWDFAGGTENFIVQADEAVGGTVTERAAAPGGATEIVNAEDKMRCGFSASHPVARASGSLHAT